MEKIGVIARRAGLAIVELTALAYYAVLLLNNSVKIHEPRLFGDSHEYLRMATKPLFSALFWLDKKPPVTALFYKSVGDDPNRIFTLQLYFSILCWGLLALVVASAVKSFALKPIVFCVVLAFSLSRDIFIWDPFIGSESITISLTALFVAAALWLVNDWKRYKIAALIGAALLLALARDASAYLLPMAGAACLPFLFYSRRRWDLAVIVASFLVIFAISIGLSRGAKRQVANFASVTAFRILPNDQYVDFFRHLGMPVDQSLVEQSRLGATPDNPKYGVLGALLAAPNEASYREWVAKNGTTSYLKFVWFFKANTLQDMFTHDAQDVFYPDVYYYTATGYRPILKNERLAELLYPTRLGLFLFFSANVAAALACGFALYRRKWLWLVPILLIWLTYPQAFIVWNGDANEIPRHSVEHNVTERLGVWLLIFFVADVLIQAALPSLHQVWARPRARYKSIEPGGPGARPMEQ